jgi:hypothetical protein
MRRRTGWTPCTRSCTAAALRCMCISCSIISIVNILNHYRPLGKAVTAAALQWASTDRPERGGSDRAFAAHNVRTTFYTLIAWPSPAATPQCSTGYRTRPLRIISTIIRIVGPGVSSPPEPGSVQRRTACARCTHRTCVVDHLGANPRTVQQERSSGRMWAAPKAGVKLVGPLAIQPTACLEAMAERRRWANAHANSSSIGAKCMV